MQFTEETAIVSHLEGDFAFLKTQNNKSCGNCTSKFACGNVPSLFAFKPKNKLKVNNSLQLKAGDSVLIGMSSVGLLKATLLMYLSPLLLMFLFSIVAKLILGEIASIVFGLVGLFLGLFFVRQYTQQKTVAEQFHPKLIRKIINVDSK